MSALLPEQSQSKKTLCGKSLKKSIIRIFLLAIMTLFLLQACSDHKGDRRHAGAKRASKSAEEIASWKSLIGNTYHVKGQEPVSLRFLPGSSDRIELGEGEKFTVKDLLVDEADIHDSHYALELRHGGRAYIRVLELYRLIETQRFAIADRPARALMAGMKNALENTGKDDSSVSGGRPAVLEAGYGFIKAHRSWQSPDLLTEEWGFQTVLTLVIIALGTCSIVRVLWQRVGIKRAFCLLTILCLGYWQFSSSVANDTIWGLLLILLALTILLASLLGVWNFVRFIVLLGNSLVMLRVLTQVYREINSPVLVALVSILAAGITVLLFFLLTKIRLPDKENSATR